MRAVVASEVWAFSVIVKTSPEVLYSSEIYLAASNSRVGAYFYSQNYICISLNWAILDKLSDKWIINNKSSVPSLSWCKNFDQILYWKSGNQLWAECQSRCHQDSWCICDIYQTIKLFSLPFIYYNLPTCIQWIIQICLILCIKNWEHVLLKTKIMWISLSIDYLQVYQGAVVHKDFCHHKIRMILSLQCQ